MSARNSADSTSWTLIRCAADGSEDAREAFVLRYLPVVRAFLAARWTGEGRGETLEDAIQDVFVECLRMGGVLDRIDEIRKRSFHSFFYGVCQNVARTHERRIRRDRDECEEVTEALPDDDPGVSAAFDRAWARAVLSEALDLQRERAGVLGPEALARVDLLQQRFHDGIPVREIAARSGEPAEKLHRQLTRGRTEFQTCLREVMREQVGTGEGFEIQVERIRELLA